MRHFFSSQIVTIDPINTTGNGTHVIPRRRQAKTTVLDDAAAAGVIREPVEQGVNRRHVERPEEVRAGPLQGTFDDDGRGQLLDDPANPGTAKISPHHETQRGVVEPPIGQKQVDDVEKPAVQGGFTAQDADALPEALLSDALGDEGLYGRDGHFTIAGRLGAGPVAV